jgi:hypothetical protein
MIFRHLSHIHLFVNSQHFTLKCYRSQNQSTPHNLSNETVACWKVCSDICGPQNAKVWQS